MTALRARDHAPCLACGTPTRSLAGFCSVCAHLRKDSASFKELSDVLLRAAEIRKTLADRILVGEFDEPRRRRA